MVKNREVVQRLEIGPRRRSAQILTCRLKHISVSAIKLRVPTRRTSYHNRISPYLHACRGALGNGMISQRGSLAAYQLARDGGGNVGWSRGVDGSRPREITGGYSNLSVLFAAW